MSCVGIFSERGYSLREISENTLVFCLKRFKIPLCFLNKGLKSECFERPSKTFKTGRMNTSLCAFARSSAVFHRLFGTVVRRNSPAMPSSDEPKPPAYTAEPQAKSSKEIYAGMAYLVRGGRRQGLHRQA